MIRCCVKSTLKCSIVGWERHYNTGASSVVTFISACSTGGAVPVDKCYTSGRDEARRATWERVASASKLG